MLTMLNLLLTRTPEWQLLMHMLLQKMKDKKKVRSIDRKKRELATKDIISDNNNDKDLEVKAKKPNKSQTVTLEVPRKILKAPGICQMLDRTKQCTRFAMGNIAPLVKAVGGDLEVFSLSKSTVWTTRNAKRVEEYEKFYTNGMVRL